MATAEFFHVVHRHEPPVTFRLASAHCAVFDSALPTTARQMPALEPRAGDAISYQLSSACCGCCRTMVGRFFHRQKYLERPEKRRCRWAERSSRQQPTKSCSAPSPRLLGLRWCAICAHQRKFVARAAPRAMLRCAPSVARSTGLCWWSSTPAFQGR